MKICMISVYPPSNEKHCGMSGVASYTRNLTNGISCMQDVNIVIFANKLDNKKSHYEENRIEIHRCWNKSLLYPFQIFLKILKEKNIDAFHVQHEFFLFGGILSSILFPFMLLLMKIFRKPIFVTLHGVIPLSQINSNVDKFTSIKVPPSFLKFGIFTNVKLIEWLSSKIIVHEDHFKKVLKNEYKIENKVLVIPHGIEKLNRMMKKLKKGGNLNNKKVLLFFGYITKYKGLEILIDAFNYLKDDNYILFICGGEHPRIKDDKDYKKYVENLKDNAEKISKNIVFKGFLSEKEIPSYFSLSDLIILPYTVGMSSSGPLNLAISYNKPFMVSEALGNSINLKDNTFRPDGLELARKINEFFKSNIIKKYCLNYMKKMREERSWKNVAKMHFEAYKGLK